MIYISLDPLDAIGLYYSFLNAVFIDRNKILFLFHDAESLKHDEEAAFIVNILIGKLRVTQWHQKIIGRH